MTDDLVRYLREYRERYTREALTNQLIAQGHDPAAVEAAWARLTAEDAGGWSAAPRPSDTGGGTIAGVVIMSLLIVGTYGLAIALTLLLVGAGSYAGTDMPAYPIAILVIYAIAMLAGGLFSLWRLFKVPSAGTGAAGILTAFAISVLIFVGLSGLCIVGLNAVPYT